MPPDGSASVHRTSGGPRAAPTASRRRACVVPPRHRSPSIRLPRPPRPQADRALRRPSLVGAQAWSRLGPARLRLARLALPVLRRTARCADRLSSARRRGPASPPLAFDSPPRPARPQADRALRRPSLVGAQAWSRLASARLRLGRPALPVLRRTARCADRFSSARMRGPASPPLAFDSAAPHCPSSGGPRAAPTASRRRACVVPPRHHSPSTRSVFGPLRLLGSLLLHTFSSFPLSPVPICSILNHVVQELPGPATCPLKRTSG